ARRHREQERRDDRRSPRDDHPGKAADEAHAPGAGRATRLGPAASGAAGAGSVRVLGPFDAVHGPDAAVDQALEKLLRSGPRTRIDRAGRDAALQLRERHRTREDRRAELTRPTRIALLARRRERPVLDHVGGREEGVRERVDAGDVGVEQVGPADALPPKLRVEVEAAGRETTGGEDLVEGQRQLVDGVRELIGVPAILVVATVDVDAAESAERDRTRDLVMEAVTCQRRVVGFAIQSVLASQTMSL